MECGAQMEHSCLLKPTRPLGFHRGTMKSEYHPLSPAFELILDSFHSSLELEIRLPLSTISRTVYIHVFISARFEWKHSVSFSPLLASSVPSHGMTFLPPSFRTRFDSLRFITLVIVPSRELRGRVISHGYPSDWVAKRRFSARFLARSPAN